MIIGYARVSTPGQDEDLQLAELAAAGCEKVFAERITGARGGRRPQLINAISELGPGDLLIFTSLSRFGRSVLDALHNLEDVVKRGAGFRSLEQPWADTTTPGGEMVTTIFLAFAELDRKDILKRTAAGRVRARARGVKFGRRHTLTHRQKTFVLQELAKDPPTPVIELAALLRVSRSTIWRVGKAGPPDGPPAELAEQLDLEAAIELRRHPLSCAIHTSGLGNTVRCTCGIEVSKDLTAGDPAEPKDPRP
jgi:DNA invertase Pin-like site-specific DNA recombinase